MILMAGPYTLRMKFADGKVLDAYIAGSNAIGTLLPVDLNAAVASTSEKSFKLPGGGVLIDYYTNVPDASPGAKVEIIADESPTGKYLTLDASMASTNQARVVPKLTFRDGVIYKLSVKVAVPA